MVGIYVSIMCEAYTNPSDRPEGSCVVGMGAYHHTLHRRSCEWLISTFLGYGSWATTIGYCGSVESVRLVHKNKERPSPVADREGMRPDGTRACTCGHTAPRAESRFGHTKTWMSIDKIDK